MVEIGDLSVPWHIYSYCTDLIYKSDYECLPFNNFCPPILDNIIRHNRGVVSWVVDSSRRSGIYMLWFVNE